MKLADQILICRGSTTYRANIDALSSVILFRSTSEDFISNLDAISASLDSLTAFFDAYAYSKSEMRATFSTKESVDALTSNSQYVLTGDAKSATDSLLSKSDLNTWETNTSHDCVDRLIKGYKDAVNLVNAEPIEGDKIGEYSHAPRYSDIAP